MKYWIVIWSFVPLYLFAQTEEPRVQIKRYYDQEKTILKERYFLRDSTSKVIEGPYDQYYQNGKRAASLTYKDNKPTGPVKYFFENGNLKIQGSLKDGESSGEWTYFFENGQVSRSGNLVDGVRDGMWVHHFENGQTKSKGRFIRGERDGIWNFFYEDGSLKAQAIYTEGIGDYKEFYTSGALKMTGQNRSGRSEGLWKFYYESGELEAEGSFENGLKTGSWKHYHQNGNLKGDGEYKGGRKDGPWVYFHEDGQTSSQGVEVDGQKDGFWNMYYQTGELKGRVSYVDGEGEYEEYYENGRLKQKGKMIDDTREGHWEYYTEDGGLEGEADFVDGLGDFIGFYPNGSLKMKGQMMNSKRIGDWELYNPDGVLAGTYKPIYEEDDPVFFTEATLSERVKEVNYNKPAYRFKKNSWKYFKSSINEYKGIIVSVDPLRIPFGQLSGSLEYYFQERLGHEFQGFWIQDPLFEPHSDIGLNISKSSGWAVKYRQKYYSDDGALGMFYFGHEIGYTEIAHTANVIDSTSLVTFQRGLETGEQRFQYGVFIGNRWMQNVSNGGFTVDIYLGVGIGWRSLNRNFEERPEYQPVFNDLETSKRFFPVLFGMQIGFVAPKSKTFGF